MRSQISTRQRIDYDFCMTNENPDDNPFAPPTVQSSLVRDVQQPSSRSLIIYWIIAFCINLPLPVMLGDLRTSGPGNIGMIIGCVIVNVTGLWLCRVAIHWLSRIHERQFSCRLLMRVDFRSINFDEDFGFSQQQTIAGLQQCAFDVLIVDYRQVC